MPDDAEGLRGQSRRTDCAGAFPKDNVLPHLTDAGGNIEPQRYSSGSIRRGEFLRYEESVPQTITANLLTLPILYQDSHFIAVAKPAGMFVHRSDNDRSDETAVVQLLRDQIGSFVYPIHRLDRATSGIVMLGLSAEAAAAAGQLFAQRHVAKTYRALVRGFCAAAGRITTSLVSERGRGKPVGHPHAVPQEAETEFRRSQRFELPFPNNRHSTTRCSLVEVRPHTGRFHQIRRHFNYESHPVIGDTSHGDTRHNAIYRKHFGLQRLMLAAMRLQFRHPFNEEIVCIENPPEGEFQDLIATLSERHLYKSDEPVRLVETPNL